jgi:endonuclease G
MSRPNSWDANPSSSLTQYSGGYEHSNNENTDVRGLAYDRGHMLANMMRNQCSYNAQKQTFFHTNQIPQVNSFNQGKWVALEKKELLWRSECDTMYVVTGPIFDQGYYTTPDKNGNKIPVATRCFKAMIKCKWSKSNGELIEVKGIGFLMDNVADAASQAYTEAYTSIEEVEKACGFTLFTNLPPEFRSAKQNGTPSNFTTNW